MNRADVRRAADEARRGVARLARPVGDFDPGRYFRGEVDLRFHNAGTEAMRRFARTIHAKHEDA